MVVANTFASVMTWLPSFGVKKEHSFDGSRLLVREFSDRSVANLL